MNTLEALTSKTIRDRVRNQKRHVVHRISQALQGFLEIRESANNDEK